jgi:uncharacterized membrane protein
MNEARDKLRKRLYVVAAVIALLGLADGIYLTVEHVTGRTAQCIASSGCQDVLSSEYAAFGPVPLAALGALAYFSAFSLALLAAFDYPKSGALFALLTGIMFATTLWLLYLQAYVLHAFCDYCLFSAAVTTALAAIAISNALLRGQS